MTLAQWLKENRISPETFAATIHVHPVTIYRWIKPPGDNEARIPKKQNLLKVVRGTNGQVRIEDFFQISAPRPASKRSPIPEPAE
jgi:hypothetical protein